jgi:hypothetical protein
VTIFLTAGIRPAAAQEPNRMFRGLFGGAAPVAARGDVLDFTASAFAGYAKDIQQPEPVAVPQSSFEGANASLTYQHQWDHGEVGAFGSGGTAYVAERKTVDLSPWVNRWSVGGRGAFDHQIGRRTSFSAAGTVGYSPYYGFGIGGFGGMGGGIFSGGFASGPDRVQSVPGLDYTVAEQPTLNSSGNVALTRTFSSRSSFDLYYGITDVTFLAGDTEGFGDTFSQTAGGRYRYRINRYVSARAGYGYFTSRYPGTSNKPVSGHTIDAGVDSGYGHEYNIARRTTFSFNTNSSVFVTDRASGENTSTAHFFVGGNVGLAHRWGRSWQADARYVRSAGFVDGFSEPVIGNTASASVRGVPLPRLDFIALASHVSGAVGFTGSNNGYSTTTSTAQLRYALFRNLAAYAQYFFYRYNFQSGVILPGGVPPRLDRQGGSIGLTLWVPFW